METIVYKFFSETNIVIPKMMSEANSSHSPLFLSHEHGRGNFTEFENSYKINENTYFHVAATIIFFHREKGNLYYM